LTPYYCPTRRSSDLNQNYRSSAPLIEAMNLFFKPSEDFDTFYYQGEKEGIVYHHVDSPGNGKGVLLYGNKVDFPITIIESNLAEDRKSTRLNSSHVK